MSAWSGASRGNSSTSPQKIVEYKQKDGRRGGGGGGGGGSAKSKRTVVPFWKQRTEDTHASHLSQLATIASAGASSSSSSSDVFLLPLDTLLLGDSMIERWLSTGAHLWKSYSSASSPSSLDLSKVFNAGIGGDKTQNVLWRLEGERSFLLPRSLSHSSLDSPSPASNVSSSSSSFSWRLSPRFAILHIGTNNLENDSAEDILEGIEAILSKLFTDSAQNRLEKVIVLSIFPRVFPSSSKGKDNSTLFQQRLETLNSSLNARYPPSAASSSLSTSKSSFSSAWADKVEFRDLNLLFLESDGKRLNSGLYSDHVHLNRAGYGLYFPELIKILEELHTR